MNAMLVYAYWQYLDHAAAFVPKDHGTFQSARCFTFKATTDIGDLYTFAVIENARSQTEIS